MVFRGLRDRVWVLENDLHLPAESKALLGGHGENIFAFVKHLAIRRRKQTHHHIADRAFAAATFSYKPYRFPGKDLQINTVHGMELALILNGKMLFEVLYLYEGGLCGFIHGFDPPFPESRPQNGFH